MHNAVMHAGDSGLSTHSGKIQNNPTMGGVLLFFVVFEDVQANEEPSCFPNSCTGFQRP